ncbi:hypothetical protein [Cellulomonas hominis]
MTDSDTPELPPGFTPRNARIDAMIAAHPEVGAAVTEMQVLDAAHAEALTRLRSAGEQTVEALAAVWGATTADRPGLWPALADALAAAGVEHAKLRVTVDGVTVTVHVETLADQPA